LYGTAAPLSMAGYRHLSDVRLADHGLLHRPAQRTPYDSPAASVIGRRPSGTTQPVFSPAGLNLNVQSSSRRHSEWIIPLHFLHGRTRPTPICSRWVPSVSMLPHRPGCCSGATRAPS